MRSAPGVALTMRSRPGRGLRRCAGPRRMGALSPLHRRAAPELPGTSVPPVSHAPCRPSAEPVGSPRAGRPHRRPRAPRSAGCPRDHRAGPRWGPRALARLGRLIDTAPALPAAQRFARHLDREFPAVLAFLWAPDVDATNWRAEHAIRPAVVNRKICGGNRTPRGARTQQVLASVVRTARQRHVDLDDLFTSLLRAPRSMVPAAFRLPTL